MTRRLFIIVLIALAITAFVSNRREVFAVDIDSKLEQATFKRESFFGTEASVPIPLVEAFANLQALRNDAGDDPKLLEKLADVAERVGNYAVAEESLKTLAGVRTDKTALLADFYARRGSFEAQAEVWAFRLANGSAEERPTALNKLLAVARKHALGRFLSKDYLGGVAEDNDGNYAVFEQLIENEYDPERKLELIRGARAAFADENYELLKQEIATLVELDREDEAEQVYIKSFSPFWDEDLSRDFYDFLDGRDRLRAYGRELRDNFRKDPSNVDAAVRYAHFSNYDYGLDGETFESISKRLEAAKKSWTTDELVLVARMLIRENDAADASRFLYTLVLRDDFKKGSEKRGQVLYQLFEMFADAGKTRIPIGKGDLDFYSDVARADTDPGILTGILSLLFSDTNPGGNLDRIENELGAEFNRAAAYRVFLAFKEEDPTSPLLAQMFLDLIRLYAAKEETKVASSLLDEFASKYEASADFPLAAIKLADAFAASGDGQRERETLQKVLDHFGAQHKPLAPSGAAPSDRNSGIEIPKKDSTPRVKDLLDRTEVPVTYAEALDRMVASYSREKKVAEILSVYSNEIGKYPDEEWLYVRRLSWLESAGLTDEQLAVFRAALARFQSRSWQDKLARFLLRQKRTSEFNDLATDLAGRLEESEAEDFLNFANGNNIGPSLAVSLYKRAHERFPHNMAIVQGLMRTYRSMKNETDWRRLAAENFFESTSIRTEFLNDLAKRGELRGSLQKAVSQNTTIGELFRAEASSRLSEFESAAISFARLNEAYPSTPDFNDRLIELERSFGQRDRSRLEGAANLAHKRADAYFDNSQFRTTAGEIFAEAGKYPDANAEWQRIISIAAGDRDSYLETASVQWDYYQYEEALKTIEKTRAALKNKTMFAFEAGSIRESLGDRTGALREFISALKDPEKEYQSRGHLVRLAKRANDPAMFDSAFREVAARTNNDPRLTVTYGEVLDASGRTAEGERLILDGVASTNDAGLLREAREFFSERNRGDAERAVMRRISETSTSAKRRIKNGIEIAESFADEDRRDEARDAVLELLKQNPTNYGAIIESANFLGRTGFGDEAANVLREALGKSRGRFRPALAGQLAETLSNAGKPEIAVAEISRLQTEDPGNASVFEALVQSSIAAKDSSRLRAAFENTVKAFRAKTKSKALLDYRVAGLRELMIDAYTRLEDYDSAIDQYIELINADPANQWLTEKAIKYTERYGGRPRLLAYYEKLAAESFKNYRWSVILARLKDASGDADGAIAEYDKAILNQPEMDELQMSAAEIEIKRSNYDAALKRIDRALELSNNEPAILRRKIDVLKLAGRTDEIDAVRAKLPQETAPSKDKDKFDEARRAAREDREKAKEIFKKAFEELRSDPMSGDPKAADIRAYADAVRGEISLADINTQLWELRAKYIAVAASADTNGKVEANRRRGIIETAIVETIGGIAGTTANDVELTALHEDLTKRIDAKLTGEDRAKASAIVRDLARRAGFGDIEEMMLIADAQADLKQNRAKLLDFYQKRGAYQKSFDAAAKFGADARTRAESARLVGNRGAELAALTEIWEGTAANSEMFDRYFTILLETDPEKLKSLARTETKHPYALINFFVRRGMAEDAHRAVDASSGDKGWKVARHAQIVYALNEKGDAATAYFDAALKFMPIGRLVAQTFDADDVPTGEDWFRIAQDYGRWRMAQGDQKAAKFVPAMTEGLPRSAAEQFNLGVYYLEKKDPAAALERFRLATEVDNLALESADNAAAVGAALWKLGNRDEAAKKWRSVIDRGDLNDDRSLMEMLARLDIAAEGRSLLAPVVSSQSEYSEDVRALVVAIADSFGDDQEASAKYFLAVCNSARRAPDIAETMADILEGVRREPFLAIMIRAEREPRRSNYSYEAMFRRAFRNRSVAEAIYDHANNFGDSEVDSPKLERAHTLLDSMMERGALTEAGSLLTDAERWIDGRYPRPVWMRVMRIKIDAKAGTDVLANAERFIGIDVPDAVTAISPPSLERFNQLREIEPRLNMSFFARRIALSDYDAANFIGLAKAMKDAGNIDGAKRMIALMTEIAGDRRESAAREIASLPVVKSRLADPTRFDYDRELPSDLAARMRIAAQTGDDLGDPRSALLFRKLLAEAPDASASDRIAYAKAIVSSDKPTAMRLLIAVVDDFATTRPLRWQARAELERAGSKDKLPDIQFDAFSQYYLGVFATEGRSKWFVNSLLADPNAVSDARPELVKAYGREALPFAALELGKSLASAKPDDVLDVLSTAAETVGDLGRALEFERARKDGGRADRIAALKKLIAAQPKPATDLVIDGNRTTQQ